MQLIYHFNIFEDNYSILRNHFETDSVNVFKNRPLVATKKGKTEFSIYISLAQPIRKP